MPCMAPLRSSVLADQRQILGSLQHLLEMHSETTEGSSASCYLDASCLTLKTWWPESGCIQVNVLQKRVTDTVVGLACCHKAQSGSRTTRNAG